MWSTSCFTRRGIQMVVDGSDPALVREILEADIEAMRERHKPGAGFFEAMGGEPLTALAIVGFPAGKPQPFRVPAVYRISALSSAHALVSLPDYRGETNWYAGADYLYFSTAHWRPIVNGFGRAEPPDHPHVISHMKAFPGPNNARTMRELGVEYVVFHAARHPDGGGRQ